MSVRHRPVGAVQIPDPFGTGPVDVMAAVALVGLGGVDPIEAHLAVYLVGPHIRLHHRSVRRAQQVWMGGLRRGYMGLGR